MKELGLTEGFHFKFLPLTSKRTFHQATQDQLLIHPHLSIFILC